MKLSCPFCGSEGAVGSFGLGVMANHPCAYIQCGLCGVRWISLDEVAIVKIQDWQVTHPDKTDVVPAPLGMN